MTSNPGSGAVVWLTGLPSSGKTRLARRTLGALREKNLAACLLDGDEMRMAVVPGHDYAEASRRDFYKTLTNLAVLLADQGLVVLIAATAHSAAVREAARLRASKFYEVWLDVSAEDCAKRDSKGLYLAVREGRIKGIPGADVEYEKPDEPDVVAKSGDDETAVEAIVGSILRDR